MSEGGEARNHEAEERDMLMREVEERRNDPEFMGRLERILREDAGVLERLAQGEDHEAGIEAATTARLVEQCLPTYGPHRKAVERAARTIIAAYLSRCLTSTSAWHHMDAPLRDQGICANGVEAAERAVIASARTRGWRGNDLEAWSLKADARAAVEGYLSRCPSPERNQLTRLIAGIQWVRGMCSDEEPYEVIDAKLAELLDEDHETSDAVRGDPCGTPVEWPGRQPTDPDRGQLRDAAIPASGRGRQSGQGEDHEAGMVGRPDCEDCGIAQALRADLVALRSRASASERDTEKNALQALVDEARADDEWVSGNDLLIRVGAIVLDRLAGLAGEPTEGADT